MTRPGYSRQPVGYGNGLTMAAITGLNPTTGRAQAITRYGAQIQIDTRPHVGAVQVTPAIGEQWLIQQVSGMPTWTLLHKMPTNSPAATIPASAGQTQIGASGPLQLHGSAINANAPISLQAVNAAARPDASSVPAGTTVYDIALGLPIYSDGTAWRDSAGATVDPTSGADLLLDVVAALTSSGHRSAHEQSSSTFQTTAVISASGRVKTAGSTEDIGAAALDVNVVPTSSGAVKSQSSSDIINDILAGLGLSQTGHPEDITTGFNQLLNNLFGSTTTIGKVQQTSVDGLTDIWDGIFGTPTPTSGTLVQQSGVNGLTALWSGIFGTPTPAGGALVQQSGVNGLTGIWNSIFGTPAPTSSTLVQQTGVNGLTNLWNTIFGTHTPTSGSLVQQSSIGGLSGWFQSLTGSPTVNSSSLVQQTGVNGLTDIWNSIFGTYTPTSGSLVQQSGVSGLSGWFQSLTGSPTVNSSSLIQQSAVSELTSVWNSIFGTHTPTTGSLVQSTAVSGLTTTWNALFGSTAAPSSSSLVRSTSVTGSVAGTTLSADITNLNTAIKTAMTTGDFTPLLDLLFHTSGATSVPSGSTSISVNAVPTGIPPVNISSASTGTGTPVAGTLQADLAAISAPFQTGELFDASAWTTAITGLGALIGVHPINMPTLTTASQIPVTQVAPVAGSVNANLGQDVTVAHTVATTVQANLYGGTPSSPSPVVAQILPGALPSVSVNGVTDTISNQIQSTINSVLTGLGLGTGTPLGGIDTGLQALVGNLFGLPPTGPAVVGTRLHPAVIPPITQAMSPDLTTAYANAGQSTDWWGQFMSELGISTPVAASGTAVGSTLSTASTNIGHVVTNLLGGVPTATGIDASKVSTGTVATTRLPNIAAGSGPGQSDDLQNTLNALVNSLMASTATPTNAATTEQAADQIQALLGSLYTGAAGVSPTDQVYVDQIETLLGTVQSNAVVAHTNAGNISNWLYGGTTAPTSLTGINLNAMPTNYQNLGNDLLLVFEDLLAMVGVTTGIGTGRSATALPGDINNLLNALVGPGTANYSGTASVTTALPTWLDELQLDLSTVAADLAAGFGIKPVGGTGSFASLGTDVTTLINHLLGPGSVTAPLGTPMLPAGNVGSSNTTTAPPAGTLGADIQTVIGQIIGVTAGANASGAVTGNDAAILASGLHGAINPTVPSAPTFLSAVSAVTSTGFAENNWIFYRVAATDSNGDESSSSNVAYVFVAPTEWFLFPGAPVQITLTWYAPAGAAGYNIYRSIVASTDGIFPPPEPSGAEYFVDSVVNAGTIGTKITFLDTGS